MRSYDVIIIGAGSVGVPIAMNTAKEGLTTLVIDAMPSIGQDANKHAIGGIRATHSQKSKIIVCQKSIEIFSTWKERYNDDISWEQGGYTFLATTKEQEELLKETVQLQKQHGLNIDYVDVEKIRELIPGINQEMILGGTYSPEDGHASPLLALNAFYHKAIDYSAQFNFKEEVIRIIKDNGEIVGIKTNKAQYNARFIVNAAGALAQMVARMANLHVPVQPDSHEAGITEPVQHFFSPLVVDITPNIDTQFGNSQNYYFYQTVEGQIIFCITPNPLILGTDKRETSSFLPQIAKRMIRLLPRLKNIKVRRTWRGLYPMTPDGNPIIGFVNGLKGYINAVGMCGQGFMLGPGVGEVLSRLITDKLTEQDKNILEDFSLYRDFGVEEKLK